MDTGKVTSGDLFGTRAYLKNNYLYRMTAAVLGIYGNSKDEAFYPSYTVDSSHAKLDGSHRYTVHFAAGQLPPANAFWSLTMYELPKSLLYANALNRYLINTPMLPGMKKNPDGSLTLHIQKDSPGNDKESNWLPAPNDLIYLVMRLYWPKTEPPSILPPGEGTWKPPGIVQAK